MIQRGSASLKLERYIIDHVEVAGTSNQFKFLILKGLSGTVFRTKASRGGLKMIPICKIDWLKKISKIL